jgi:hypothetical protein
LVIQISTMNSAHPAFRRIRHPLRAGADAALCPAGASALRAASAAVLGSSTADLVSSATYPISLRYGAHSELMERITSIEHSTTPQAWDVLAARIGGERHRFPGTDAAGSQKGRMVRNLVVEIEPAEPPIGQMQLDFLGQLAF